MMWCVLFFYVGTHQPVDVPVVKNLTEAEAKYLAEQPRDSIYGVARRCD